VNVFLCSALIWTCTKVFRQYPSTMDLQEDFAPLVTFPKKPILRMATYMCPSIPIEYYELLATYLEESLDVDTTLVYDSRSPGQLKMKPDLFGLGHVDIGFVSTSYYLDLVEEGTVELLPVAAVHPHAKAKHGFPGYYADVLHRADAKERIQNLLDLRGALFAYSDRSSISSHSTILKTLYERGENPSFFSNAICSHSHIESLNLLQSKRAEVAVVDSNTLSFYLKQHPSVAEEMCVLESLGPLPPYPIVIRKTLPGKVKEHLTDAFLNMHKSSRWLRKLKEFNVVQFTKNFPQVYDSATTIMEFNKGSNRGSNFEVVYY